MASSTTGVNVLMLFAIVAVLVKQAQSQSCTGPPEFDFTGPGLITGVKEEGQDTGTPDRFLCLADLRAMNLNRLIMDCIPQDRSLTLKWFRNGVEFTNTKYYYKIEINNPVNVSCAIMNECGTSTYPVIISNSRPILSHSVTIQGNRAISPTTLCLDLSNPGRATAQFTCPVTNADQALGFERKWFKDSIEIGGTSTLESITINQVGKYRCTAGNACGSDDKGVIMQANPVIRKGNGTITSNVADIGANLCTTAPTAMLTCHILNNIQATRTWRKNGVVQSETGEVLTITPPTDTDDTYTCTVMNDCGTDTASTTVFSRVSVNLTSSIAGLTDNGCNRPSITGISGADLCPNIGETVRISCTASGSYTIRGPNGQVLATNSDYVINNYMETSDGTYTCSTSSACTSANDTITITHLGIPPTITTQGTPGNDSTDEICIAAGSTVDLTCVANGTVTSYRWYRNRVFLTNNQNLTNVGPGTYNCTASNAAGSDSRITKVVEINTVALGATPDSVNRCSQLRRPPPAGTDFCAFVGDRVTLRCTPSQAGVTTVITPDGETGQKIFNPIQLQDVGSYLCNATTECGSSTNMTNIRVYDPARIDRRKTLPAPQDNELVQGAGRTSEEVCGRDNNKISLHCCYSGFDQPTTRWLYIAEGSTQAVPVNTSDPNIMITDDDGMNSVLMINPFGERYAGIYRCNTTNIAGTDAGDVNVIYKPPEEKEWLVSTWSRCFPDCHRGVRNRTVECVTVSNRMRMDGCTPPPPPSEEQCTERGPCNEWVPGNWSVCTKTCGIGYQVRRVSCRATYDNTIGLNDTECLTARPPVFRYCNIHDCPCVEPRFCDFLVGTEMCWRADIQRDCCCTCGPAP